MRLSRKKLLTTIVIVLVMSFLSLYKLPYYIYTPGKATNLEDVVKVEEGNNGKGSFHLLTVSGRSATPLLYLISKFNKHHEIVPMSEARPHGMSDKAYLKEQLQLMENSQESSTVVAYQAANAEIDIIYNGVYVLGTIEGMPASKVLDVGDLITQIDDVKIEEADDLMSYISEKKADEEVELTFNRDNKTVKEFVGLANFPKEDKVGIGIQLVTDRKVKVNPKVNFSSGEIGGPSAGLMFALSIYNQLTEEDLTNGLVIAGSGQLDYDGNVLPIGGIDKKVIAADRKKAKVLFAPSYKTSGKSNYEVAKETAESINSDMEIVPVETFQDALDYLEKANNSN